MEISAQQLAELLLGIARAQAAMIQGLENEMAGVRSGRSSSFTVQPLTSWLTATSFQTRFTVLRGPAGPIRA